MPDVLAAIAEVDEDDLEVAFGVIVRQIRVRGDRRRGPALLRIAVEVGHEFVPEPALAVP